MCDSMFHFMRQFIECDAKIGRIVCGIGGIAAIVTFVKSLCYSVCHYGKNKILLFIERN